MEAYSGSVPQGVDRNTNETQVNFTGLMPGTEYNVAVSTIDIFGEVESGPNFTDITRKI